ncbi:MAG: antitoxin component YwqK of YwqJK toxin-antitoxin module [Sediminicola sp.]|mgnify:CR=1 FL=1|jgi:antitoxin component YwqK of YwqJK toxin-antitoxin module|tara:strand:- start:5 stop:382 length:378 start_codon:yes stop_codon:yes gene_type:complete
MKKLILVLVVLLSANVMVAQSCKTKTVCKKDSYVLNNGLIEATLFHKNGVVSQTGFYTEDNKLQGEWISYDIEGNKTATANYNNGEKVGTWTFYQGAIQKEVTYKDSRISKVNTWEKTDTRIVTN